MPIRIPVITSQTACREVIPPLILLPFSRRKARMNRPPIRPRVQARNAEEAGIYLLNTPIEPKTSIEEMIMTSDLGSFFRLSIV